MRWRTVDDESCGQGALFAADDLVERHVGTGEFRGLEFFHVNARRVISEVPAASRMPFRHTINPYRGCSHACSYCLAGWTPVLLANGRSRPIAELRRGDLVYGTEKVGNYRRYVPTEVRDHWSTVRRAYRVVLADGTTLVASGEHRFLTERGWKHVTDEVINGAQRPHLTTNNSLLGFGSLPEQPKHGEDYRLGYLSGMIRGDGTIGQYVYARSRGVSTVHRFRLALVDVEALERARLFLGESGIVTDLFEFAAATEKHRRVQAIRTSKRHAVRAIESLIQPPASPTEGWLKGFLAGVFDAEGGCSRGVWRITNKDPGLLAEIVVALTDFGFDFVVEPPNANGCRSVRLRGGLRERLRFSALTDPAITRKRVVDGTAIKSDADLRVVAIEDLGIEIPMFDITTGTGDFIANGVVSHNCFARPTHEYLELDTGVGFDTQIVVKVNAVERLRAELRGRRWAGHHIAMGTNTDPYQRAEGKYHLTRGIVETLGQARNPFSILTKSSLIVRDIDVLTEAAARTDVSASFSIGTLDPAVWKATEPGTPHPRQRVGAMARLNDAGIPCGVLMAPILPGISDSDEQLAEVVDACVEAGASGISAMGLHLRRGVREVFLARLAETHPELVADYERRYANRAYLPPAYNRDLAERVRRMVGDRLRPRPSSRRWMRREQSTVTVDVAPDQLELRL